MTSDNLAFLRSKAAQTEYRTAAAEEKRVISTLSGREYLDENRGVGCLLRQLENRQIKALEQMSPEDRREIEDENDVAIDAFNATCAPEDRRMTNRELREDRMRAA